MELQKISILTPTYNRNYLLGFYLENIKCQDYPHHLLEVVIDDDGTNKFIPNNKIDYVKNILAPIELKYLYYKNKRTIGEKRNNLVKKASSKIIINFDDDDIYQQSIISYCYYNLKSSPKISLVGTNQMIFCYINDNFKISAIQCNHKRLIHESGMMMKKKHWKSQGGYEKTSRGEGCSLIDGHNLDNIKLLECKNMLYCICHDNNTINKDRFNNENDNQEHMEISDYLKDLIIKSFKKTF
jgi:glycosyltransferase involved in cell wall biosynthesis